MINAKELRISNLVYFNGNHKHIGTVSGLGNKSILKYYCIEYEKELKVFLNNRYDIPYSPLDLKPIPLTEEWLLKFGFIKDLNNKSFNIYKHNCFDLFFRVFNENVISFCFTNEYILIKYVHQIQNLYFALTGSELTVA